MKKHSFDLKASMESIARQSGKFLDELTKCVRYLRDDKTYETTAIRNSRINEVIKLFTGITVNIYVIPGTNMFTRFPMLSGSHVLVGFRGDDTTGRMMAGINELGEIRGGIDTNKGIVTGDFSKIKCQINIGIDEINDELYTDEEVASVIIHEVGHLFTYFQYLATVVVGPSILVMAANALLHEPDRKKREIILKTAEEKLGIEKTFYKEDYISNPKPGVEVMMLTDYLTCLPAGTLDLFYNHKLAEQLADTFAVKHCGAKHLASALSKYRKYSGMQKNNFWSHLLAETGVLFKLIGVYKTDVIGLLFSRYKAERYDRPNDRYEYMKLMLIDELKTIPVADKELRDQILHEIKSIDDINKGFVYRRDVVTFFWDTVGKGKHHRERANREKALERMVYNDLFYKATQLKQLADK